MADLQTTDYSKQKAIVDTVRKAIFPGATDPELMLYFHKCNTANVHPLSQLIHPMKFNTPDGAKVAFIVSIDLLRSRSQDTNEYDGIDEPEYEGTILQPTEKEGDIEVPEKCTVRVYRKNISRPFTGIARWKEFYPGEKKGHQWRQKPYLMLAKCFDEKTEILTESGFLKFSEVKNEKIVCVKENGLRLEEAKPFSRQYSGDMVSFFSDDLNFCVTPNHDMVTTSGRIEAGVMYDLSRARPSFYIPRIAPQTEYAELVEVAASQLELAAAYLCDGENQSAKSFRIKVSRPHKIEKILSWEMHSKKTIRKVAGQESIAPSGRIIKTKNDQTEFTFQFDLINKIVTPGKRIKDNVFEKMSSLQAKIFIDAWAFFDGNMNSKGGEERTLRIYTADVNHADIIELFAIKAGYSVSRAYRDSEFKRQQIVIALSDRNEIPISRWGRFTQREALSRVHRSLEITKNETGKVWCVTVSSGIIIVRREGFSMLCGNCAEAQARRQAFPQELDKLYTAEEMDATTAMLAGIPDKMSTKPRVNPNDVKIAPPPKENTGIIESVQMKTGTKDNKKWTRYGIKINGITYGTFDTNIGELANKNINKQVVFTSKKEGEYDTLTSLKLIIDQQQTVQDDSEFVKQVTELIKTSNKTLEEIESMLDAEYSIKSIRDVKAEDQQKVLQFITENTTQYGA